MPEHALKTNEGMEVEFYALLTCALDEGEWAAS